MPIDTLDGAPSPLYRSGLSATSKLILLGALALFLMVADARFELAKPVRASIATVLYPAQWIVLQPVRWVGDFSAYLTNLKTAKKTEQLARRRLIEQSARASQVEHLQLENARLRQLLDLRRRQMVTTQAAEVLYGGSDLYSHRVVIDKGQLKGVVPGSPVMDETGVLGQVSRVYSMTSEVTLLTDPAQTTPVVNTRSGVRGVTWGDKAGHDDMLELRYIPAASDFKPGDLLVTSGIDGVYLPGLPVATVSEVDSLGSGSFARIQARTLAQPAVASTVLVLAPLAPVNPTEDADASAPNKVTGSTPIPAASMREPSRLQKGQSPSSSPIASVSDTNGPMP